jgi:hypothetical protein
MLISSSPLVMLKCLLLFSVADPDLFYTDPDPAFHFDTDPDPAFQFVMNLDSTV